MPDEFLSQTRQRATSKQFAARLGELRAIRERATEHILPVVAQELREVHGLRVDIEEVEDWLEDWLNDLGQIFRLYKKHEFNTQNTLNALHDGLLWRSLNLLNIPPPSDVPSTFVRFIPHPLLSLSPKFSPSSSALALDAASNHTPPHKANDFLAIQHASSSLITTPPILYLGLAELTRFAKDTSMTTEEKVEDLRGVLVHTYELARMYLRDLDGILQQAYEDGVGMGKGKAKQVVPEAMEERMRITQFVLMVDVRGAGMVPSFGSEMASWVLNDLAPNYPGLCSAVYVVNYSWTYNALWQVIKRVLPEKVLSRISFPSNAELLKHFPPESLLKEYGGLIPRLPVEYDEVQVRYYPGSQSASQDGSTASSSTIVPQDLSQDLLHPSDSVSVTPTPPPAPTQVPSPPATPSPTHVPAHHPSNPFFGYPTVIRHRRLPDGTFHSVPSLLHGRPRKRDFIKTLAYLYYLKFKRRVELWVQMLVMQLNSLQATAGQKWKLLRTLTGVLGLPSPLTGYSPSPGTMLAMAVVVATLALRLRRAVRIPGQTRGGLVAALFSRELSWVRDIFLLAIGLGTASIPIPAISFS
ncbi:hypothetical protein FRB99_006103 [Tulasnella sp. 403]|nr:hypothetical protein FRB99_006103 [Tulasnella sp. 403]